MKFSKLFFAFFVVLLLSSSVSYACVEKIGIIKLSELGLKLTDNIGIMVNRGTVTVGSIVIQDQKETVVGDDKSSYTFSSPFRTVVYYGKVGSYYLTLDQNLTTEFKYSFYINANGISKTINVNYKKGAAAPAGPSYFSPTKDDETITIGEGCN